MTMYSAPPIPLPGMRYDRVLDMIGNTPLVDVSNLSPNPRVRILAKMEMQNPFGSVKDRIAKPLRPTDACSRDRRSSNRRRATPVSPSPPSRG